ncbi:hypothetical protein FRC12_023151 [Ceratobasidium sp. 428]|nr:hypothetical protein FRC12_023151 [Ceratobasidium sp. 428]
MGASLSVRSQRHAEALKRRRLSDLPPRLSPLPFGPRKPCNVCFETDAEFPFDTPTHGCRHPVDVCASCIETYICTKIEGGTLTLKCPSQSCSVQMDVAEIQTSLADRHKEALESVELTGFAS